MRAPDRLDFLTRLWGLDFEGASSRRVADQPGDVAVWILSPSGLTKNKRATGRPGILPMQPR